MQVNGSNTINANGGNANSFTVNRGGTELLNVAGDNYSVRMRSDQNNLGIVRIYRPDYTSIMEVRDINNSVLIKGSGSTSATTSLLVQNSGGTELFRVYDNGQINLLPLNGAVGSPANFVANGNDLSFRCGYYFRFLTSGDNKIVFGSSWDGSNTYVYNENRQVIGANAINASAQLQVDSTTKGFLPPRMTEAQILAIASPAIGLMAYNTDKDCPVFYSAAGWRKISHSAM